MKSALGTGKKRSESAKAAAETWVMLRLNALNDRIRVGQNVTEALLGAFLDDLREFQSLDAKTLRGLARLDVERIRFCSCGLTFFARPSTRRTCSVKCAARERQARKRRGVMDGSYSVRIVAVRNSTGTARADLPVIPRSAFQ